jgi:hypothetical protein
MKTEQARYVQKGRERCGFEVRCHSQVAQT